MRIDDVDRSLASAETEEDWTQFWEPICTVGGKIDLNQIKKELHDYHTMMGNTREVFYHITDGMISKPMTSAHVVIQLFEEYVERLLQERLAEERLAEERATKDQAAQKAEEGTS